MLSQLKKAIKKLYLFIFARNFFYKFNSRLFLINLQCLGILNYENSQQSGENSFLKRVISNIKEPIIFDVGANIGSYSLSINNINPEAIIYAFEPHPLTFQKLIKNTENIHITCCNLGLGSTLSQSILFDYKNNDGSSHASLYPEVFDELKKTDKTSVAVTISTLDQFCLEHKIERIDFLKIDTEGNEFEVLKGAKILLETNKIDIIQFEFNEMNVISRVFFKDFYHLLPNFHFYRLLPNNLIPLEPYSPIFCELFAFQNIIAINKLSMNLLN